MRQWNRERDSSDLAFCIQLLVSSKGKVRNSIQSCYLLGTSSFLQSYSPSILASRLVRDNFDSTGVEWMATDPSKRVNQQSVVWDNL